VELVVVMVLIAILAANAMPRFFAASRFEEMGFADSSASAARFARRLAVNSRCDTGFSVGPTGYALFQRAGSCSVGGFTRAVNRPGGQAWSEPAPSGVAVGTLAVYFDAQGRPADMGSGALLGSAVSYAVGGRTVTIEQETGFVHLP
jgi:MSHA pilin protein MshC